MRLHRALHLAPTDVTHLCSFRGCPATAVSILPGRPIRRSSLWAPARASSRQRRNSCASLPGASPCASSSNHTNASFPYPMQGMGLVPWSKLFQNTRLLPASWERQKTRRTVSQTSCSRFPFISTTNCRQGNLLLAPKLGTSLLWSTALYVPMSIRCHVTLMDQSYSLLTDCIRFSTLPSRTGHILFRPFQLLVATSCRHQPTRATDALLRYKSRARQALGVAPFRRRYYNLSTMPVIQQLSPYDRHATIWR
jgi:hypothetical protein